MRSQDRRAIGEVLIAPFDVEGQFVDEALRDRVIAFDARQLPRVSVTIGVAGGPTKVEPILGALRAGIVNTLVTDVRTAEAVAAGGGGTVNGPRSRRPPAILAIDLGSTSAKAGLVSLDGSLLALERAAYPLIDDPGTGRAEQDPEDWWRAFVEVTRALVAGDHAEVVAIVVDGHGPTLTAVDAEGRPTRPAVTWLDSRADGGTRRTDGETGLRGWALGVLPAALWVEREEPAVADRSAWYLNTWEFIGLRLAGVARTHASAGTGSAGRAGTRSARAAGRQTPPGHRLR